jgi:hypothetical protein
MPAFRLFGFLGSYERSQAREASEARMGATVSRNLEPESRHEQGKEKGYETSVGPLRANDQVYGKPHSRFTTTPSHRPGSWQIVTGI